MLQDIAILTGGTVISEEVGLELKDAEMYITGFKAALKKDTSYKGLWTVSFTLKEM